MLRHYSRGGGINLYNLKNTINRFLSYAIPRGTIYLRDTIYLFLTLNLLTILPYRAAIICVFSSCLLSLFFPVLEVEDSSKKNNNYYYYNNC